MKRKDYTVVVIAILALTAIVFISIYYAGKAKDRYIWAKTYMDGVKQPYDFGVFKSLLREKAALDFEELGDDLEKKLKSRRLTDSSTYIFIGRYCFLTRPEIDAILDFADAGHSVMFIAEGLPDTLLQTLSYFAKPVSIDRFDEPSVRVESSRENSKAKDHVFKYRSYGKDSTTRTDWYYLDEDQQLDYYYGDAANRYIRRGSINGKLNYAMFKVGNGFVYLHTSPALFTNYALRDEIGYNYADEVFSGINTRHILFDVYSRDEKENSENIRRKSDSPLSYILKQPALKAGWYLFLVAVLLFFMFKAKRRQRIIPVLEQKRNTSVAFIETLSGLFYNDANHRQMAEIKMNLFLFFLRNKLNISTHDIKDDTIRLISMKSKVPENHVSEIFRFYNQVIKNTRDIVHPENLMEFYNRIDTFYQLYNQKK